MLGNPYVFNTERLLGCVSDLEFDAVTFVLHQTGQAEIEDILSVSEGIVGHESALNCCGNTTILEIGMDTYSSTSKSTVG